MFNLKKCNKFFSKKCKNFISKIGFGAVNIKLTAGSAAYKLDFRVSKVIREKTKDRRIEKK